MLTEIFADELAAKPGESAFLPLLEGIDALAARLGLARTAQTSLDAQYYIWRGDTTGFAVSYALLQAADRGVHVRLLLDDLQISEHDPLLLALAQHPRIEVRMFNPSTARSFKLFELLSRFATLNRRMHNKSYIADRQVAIVGGRNIGNEYFNASHEVDFSDFDVLTSGPVVPEIADTFDLYWNSELAVPISALYAGQAGTQSLEQVRQLLTASWQRSETSEYAEAVRESRFVQDLLSRRSRYFRGKAQSVADSPGKFLEHSQANPHHLGQQLQPMLNTLRSELLIITPYFIPGAALVAALGGLAQQGIKVTVLTNSLAANDVGIVHAGYSKYRKALLAAGVELYEYKSNPARITKKRRRLGIPRPSRASLHAKVFVFDRKQLFVGSMNIDPRSIRLNSEQGVIIESESFANALSDAVHAVLADNAYHLRLERNLDAARGDKRNQLCWETHEKGRTVIYDREPEVSWLRRLGIWIMSLFVAEELL